MSSPTPLLHLVRDRLTASDVFERIDCAKDTLRAFAPAVESEAWYDVSIESAGQTNNVIWVGLFTPDRWLSESIEADLMHQGDKIEELLEEELVEQGVEQGLERPLVVEHFRDDEKRYVFRSKLNTAKTGDHTGDHTVGNTDLAERLTRVILAYEACFSQLGDMSAQDETV